MFRLLKFLRKKDGCKRKKTLVFILLMIVIQKRHKLIFRQQTRELKFRGKLFQIEKTKIKKKSTTCTYRLLKAVYILNTVVRNQIKIYLIYVIYKQCF